MFSELRALVGRIIMSTRQLLGVICNQEHVCKSQNPIEIGTKEN